jgi:hypothetical protein
MKQSEARFMREAWVQCSKIKVQGIWVPRSAFGVPESKFKRAGFRVPGYFVFPNDLRSLRINYLLGPRSSANLTTVY